MTEELTILKTDVDDFLELVKRLGRVSLQDAAKELKTPIVTVQAWTDFLVEENILGIEYRFTTPYVFVEEHKDTRHDLLDMGFDTKEEFYEKARKRGIKDNHIRLLWVKYLSANKEAMKKVFHDKGLAKGFSKEKLPALWQKYYDFLMSDEEV